MTAAVSEHSFHLTPEAGEKIFGNESQQCAGKAAAMDTAGAFAVEQFFCQRQRQRKLLMSGGAVWKNVLQIKLRGEPRTFFHGKENIEIAILQGVPCHEDAAVFIKDMDGAQHSAVSRGGTYFRKPCEKLVFIHITKDRFTEDRGNSSEFFGNGGIIRREIGVVGAAVNDAEGIAVG